MATPVTPSGNAKHCDGCRDPANCKIVNDLCSVCKMQFNKVMGEPIILAGKQFHEACLKCMGCRKRVRPGWTIVHPAGIFCNNTCMQSTLERAHPVPYEPSHNDAKAFFIDRCMMCWLPLNEVRLETWRICGGNMIHQQCFKCEACGNSPLPPEGEIVMCADRFWCDNDCLRICNEKAVKAYYQPTKETEDEARGGNDDPVNGEDVNDRCGVCNKPINEVPGEQPISCGEKQFHPSCFKCLDCDKLLKPGRILMHPDGGLFCYGDYCSDRCIRSFGVRAMQVPYKPSCNNDNNFIVNSNCLVCEKPINKEHLKTCVNCSGSIIRQECFKCKACATPPSSPEGEIMALTTWFFCDDDCIGSFGEKAIEVDYQPKEAEDEMRGANEGRKMHRPMSPPRIVKQPPAEERSSRKKPPK